MPDSAGTGVTFAGSGAAYPGISAALPPYTLLHAQQYVTAEKEDDAERAEKGRKPDSFLRIYFARPLTIVAFVVFLITPEMPLCLPRPEEARQEEHNVQHRVASYSFLETDGLILVIITHQLHPDYSRR